MNSSEILDKAKEYIWRQNPPPQIDQEGIELIRALMAKILELRGELPPDTETPPDILQREEQEELESVNRPINSAPVKKPIRMVKGQSRMEF